MLHTSRALTRSAAAMLATVLAAAMLGAGCGSDDSSDGSSQKSTGGSDKKLVVYSGREEELVAPLYKQFEQDTGIELEVRYAESPELAATLKEEGAASKADVFYGQDAGALGSVEDLLAPAPASALAAVPPRFQDTDRKWIGVTGRVRVLAWNTEELEESELPTSVLDITAAEWKGKVGVAPTNASFQAFVTGLRLELGEERAEEFLKKLAANEPKIYQKNSQIAEAVSSGEVPVGLVNHYYLYELRAKDPDAPVANHFFAAGDAGNMINVSAVGIIEGGEHRAEAETFVEYLLDEGQRYFADEAEEREYPLATGAVKDNERFKELPALESIKGPDVDLSELGTELDASVQMIRKSGLGS